MGFGSVPLGLGGVRRQILNQRLEYKLVDIKTFWELRNKISRAIPAWSPQDPLTVEKDKILIFWWSSMYGMVFSGIPYVEHFAQVVYVRYWLSCFAAFGDRKFFSEYLRSGKFSSKGNTPVTFWISTCRWTYVAWICFPVADIAAALGEGVGNSFVIGRNLFVFLSNVLQVNLFNFFALFNPFFFIVFQWPMLGDIIGFVRRGCVF